MQFGFRHGYRLAAIILIIAHLHLLPQTVLAQAKISADGARNIPTEAFAALPTFDRPQLSPSGDAFAYFAEIDGRLNLIYQNMDGTGAGQIPADDIKDIIDFRWANDDVLLIRYGFYLKARYGDRIYRTRYISFNIKSFDSHWLGQPDRKRFLASTETSSQHERLLHILPDDKEHVLLELDLDLNEPPSVYRVNITTGRRSLVQGARPDIYYWYADQKGEVRLGTGFNGRKPVAKLKNADGNWLDLTENDWHKKFDVAGFTDDPNVIYVLGPTDQGTRGLFKFDLLKGKTTDLIFDHDVVDIDHIVEHAVTGRLIGVAYTHHVSRVHFFDEEWATIQRSLTYAMPGKKVRVVSAAQDKPLYLVFIGSSNDPGSYYLYDRGNKRLSLLAHRNAYLSRHLEANPTIFSSPMAVDIPVRDGSYIPGYLTLPSEGPHERLPSVILPHGGPHSRDSADWDYWAQFYASRGYAVLQPNFRGSTGYGDAYKKKGRNQWGGLMQDDVTDATKWLVQQGIADKSRICIVGGSYGGYAALMGAIKTPDLFRCAVSINGVTDIPRMKENDRKYVGGRYWTKYMGLKGTDDTDISPYDRASEITIPVLLMSSKDDARVPFAMSRDMHKRLKSKKKNSRYIQIKDGGHSMRTAASRLKVLQETEAFLAKHIGTKHIGN